MSNIPAQHNKPDIDAMIRVNHAGEYGAKRIYDGQLAVLRGMIHTNHRINDIVAEMKAQEAKHLDTFDALVRERRVRPTALAPIWHVGGWVLGAASAAMGEKAAMACTVAVESVIADHYQQQQDCLAPLKEEQALHDIVSEFRDDEMEHHDTGLHEGAEQAPAYKALYHGIRGVTKLAIKLSEKI